MSDEDLTRLPESHSSAPQVLSKGQEFGQYRIDEMVGRGGMGEVYAVTHTVLDTRHALKVIRPEILEHAEAPQRFRREAQVMAKLRHTNIIQVDDFGVTEGLTWLRMELLSGCDSVYEAKSSLSEVLLDGEPLAPNLVSDWLGQILRGLDYAHENGVVHRDLKPANLLINEDGHLKIADFGLVRLVGEDWLQSQVQQTVARSIADPDATRLEVENESSKAAGTSALLGTFEFMSPEQKKGSEVDHRSDLYAIGLIAYRMLTGESTIGFDLPSDLVDGLDTSWDDWVRKASATKIERRFQSAAGMLSELPENARKRMKAAKSRTKAAKSGTRASSGASRTVASRSAVSIDQTPSKYSLYSDQTEGAPQRRAPMAKLFDEAQVLSNIEKGAGDANTGAGIIRSAAELTELDTKSAMQVCDGFWAYVAKEVRDASRLEVPKFGVFRIKKIKAHAGINPQTGEKIKIKACKQLSFTPSYLVKERLKSGSIKLKAPRKNSGLLATFSKRRSRKHLSQDVKPGGIDLKAPKVNSAIWTTYWKGRGRKYLSRRRQMCVAVHEYTGVPLYKISLLLDTIFLLIELRLQDAPVVFAKRGKFTAHRVKPRKNGINPQTGERIQIPEGLRVTFKTYLPLKRALGIAK